MIHERVLTTSRESANKKGRSVWLGFLASRSCNDWKSTYVFTDGSSKGSFAAVFVCPMFPNHREKPLEEFVAWKPTATANMGAEWNGLLLGLKHAAGKIIVVSDLLWLGAWMVGKRKAEHPETVTALKEAKRLIEVRGLDVQFVHHGGHQKDSSDFTRWNRRADELCKLKAKEIASA